MKRYVTTLIVACFILLAQGSIVEQALANHSCGSTSDEFTAEGASTHGCGQASHGGEENTRVESVPAKLGTDGGNWNDAKKTREDFKQIQNNPTNTTNNYDVDSSLHSGSTAKDVLQKEGNCPKATDGQSLCSQTKEAQDLFNKTYGANAAYQWLLQHTVALQTNAITIDKNYDYITFTCSRCGSDRRCQTEIGDNPQFSTGAGAGSCTQVDRRSKTSGPDSGWEAVKLCDTSCSGSTSSETHEKTSTKNKTSKKPTPTPTPTPTGPQCQNIKIYKDNQLIDVTTVNPGDHIVVAVAGTNATKGRFRFNGAPLNNEPSGFTESTGTNTSDEFTLPLTIPTNVTSIKIEAEVFKNGVWQ